MPRSRRISAPLPDPCSYRKCHGTCGCEFADVLRSHGVKIVPNPPRSPNCSPHAERFVRSIKSECLDRMIFFGEMSIGRALTEYELHFFPERNHQGLENRLIDPEEAPAPTESQFRKRQRLGGLLSFYFRRAA